MEDGSRYLKKTGRVERIKRKQRKKRVKRTKEYERRKVRYRAKSMNGYKTVRFMMVKEKKEKKKSKE